MTKTQFGCVWCVLSLLASSAIVRRRLRAARSVSHRDRSTRSRDEAVSRTMGSLLGPPIVDGNKVTTLVNGDRDLPGDARGDPLRQAHDQLRDVHLLARRQSAGSSPTRWLSAPGGREGARHHRRDRRRHADGQELHPHDAGGRRTRRAVSPAAAGTTSPPPHRLNNRTHRKLLIVDGKVGFTGGVGIADEWRGDARVAEALARHALPRRGPGGRAAPGGVRRQLDGNDRRRAARRRLLPGRSNPRASRRRRCSRAPPTAAARACS